MQRNAINSRGDDEEEIETLPICFKNSSKLSVFADFHLPVKSTRGEEATTTDDAGEATADIYLMASFLNQVMCWP
jgi:hypothetical protein